MFVSSNELRALVRRCFEVVSAGQQDYDDFARVVVWLEMRGLPGIDSLIDAATDIESRNQAPPVALAQSDPGVRAIAAAGASLLGFVCNLTDVVIATAVNTGDSQIEITGCTHALSVIACMERCANRNLNAIAIWKDDRADQLHIARARAGERSPDYRVVATTSDGGLRPQALVLRCSRTSELTDFEIPANAHDINHPLEHVTPAEFISRHARCRDEGIDVDAGKLQALSTIADRILVEASEESRRGAGE